MKRFIAAATLVAVILAGGCSCHQQACAGYPPVFFIFTGFDSTSLKQVVVRRWDTGTFYTKLADTIALDIYDQQTGDGRMNGGALDLFHYNIEISFPVISKTVRLYSFQAIQESQEVCPGLYKKELECTNSKATFIQDGSTKQLDELEQNVIMVAR